MKTAGTSRHCHLPLARVVLSQVTVPNVQPTARRRARSTLRQLLQCFHLRQGANELSLTVEVQCRRPPPNPRLQDRGVFPVNVLDSLLYVYLMCITCDINPQSDVLDVQTLTLQTSYEQQILLNKY